MLRVMRVVYGHPFPAPVVNARSQRLHPPVTPQVMLQVKEGFVRS